MPSGPHGRKGIIGTSMTTHRSPKAQKEARQAAAAASRRKSPRRIYYSQAVIDSEVARLRSEGKFKEAANMANTRSKETEVARLAERSRRLNVERVAREKENKARIAREKREKAKLWNQMLAEVEKAG